MKGKRAGRDWGLYLCFPRETWMNCSQTSQWRCSGQPAVSHGAVRQSGLFLRGIHEKHVGESLFSTRQNEALRRAPARWLRQEGLEHCLGMQTLAWQEDSAGSGTPNNLERLQSHHRNALCLSLRGIPGSSQCHRPAHLTADWMQDQPPPRSHLGVLECAWFQDI